MQEFLFSKNQATQLKVPSQKEDCWQHAGSWIGFFLEFFKQDFVVLTRRDVVLISWLKNALRISMVESVRDQSLKEQR